MKKPYPVPTPDSRPFWNGLAEQKIAIAVHQEYLRTAVTQFA